MMSSIATKEVLDVLMDVITDYPLCASESDMADMELVHRNVEVLRSLHLALMFQSSFSPFANKN